MPFAWNRSRKLAALNWSKLSEGALFDRWVVMFHSVWQQGTTWEFNGETPDRWEATDANVKWLHEFVMGQWRLKVWWLFVFVARRLTACAGEGAAPISAAL